MVHLTAAAEIPAVCAAIGVDFFTFLKPSDPHDVRTMYWPRQSVTWICVLQRERKDNVLSACSFYGLLTMKSQYFGEMEDKSQVEIRDASMLKLLLDKTSLCECGPS